MEHLIAKLKKVKRLMKEADDMKFDDLPEKTKEEVRMDEAWSGGSGFNRYGSAVDSARNVMREEAKKLINSVIKSLEQGGIEIPDAVMSANNKEIVVGQLVEHKEISYMGRVTEILTQRSSVGPCAWPLIKVQLLDSDCLGGVETWDANLTVVLQVKR